MSEGETSLALRMFSTGFARVVEDAFATYDNTGIWVGEATVADTGLARVTTGREPNDHERDAAMNVTVAVVGARKLSEGREARIASAAEVAVDKYRRRAIAFPDQYISQDDVVLEADDLAGGRTTSLVDGTMVRCLPLSRVERVVLQALGFFPPIITYAGEVIEQGADALNWGQTDQDEFADSMRNHEWLFRNADRADYKSAASS